MAQGRSGCKKERPTRTPASPETQHIQEEKRRADPALRGMTGPVIAVQPDQHGDDKVRDEHGGGAQHQEGASAQGVHGPEGAGDADELRDVEDAGEDELHAVV